MTYQQQRIYRRERLRAERKGDEIAPTSLVSGSDTAAQAANALNTATAAAAAAGTPASSVAVIGGAASATSTAAATQARQQTGKTLLDP